MPAVADPGHAAFDEEAAAVALLAEAQGSVRVFGEMVSLLWDAGDVIAAIELETLCNELRRKSGSRSGTVKRDRARRQRTGESRSGQAASRSGHRLRSSPDALGYAGNFTFTASHRAGVGSPVLCLHGFADTWRSWELVLPALERRHDVLALTLPGHAGGPPLERELTDDTLVDQVERSIDAAGIQTAHIVGNSLGGYLALRLAARGRASSVVALAPAGGWADGDRSSEQLLALQLRMIEQARAAAPHVDAIVASAEGRRRATELIAANFEHIPPELIAHQTVGVARALDAPRLIEHGLSFGWPLDAERITCPLRVVWGTADKLLPWPSSAARYRSQLLPQADWIELEGIGHYPQLDAPLETAQLILGFTA